MENPLHFFYSRRLHLEGSVLVSYLFLRCIVLSAYMTMIEEHAFACTSVHQIPTTIVAIYPSSLPFLMALA
jgi:hypothetical protein